MNTKRRDQILMIAKLAIVAALYFALTVLIAPLSYGEIQIRFSEVLLILCFFDRRYGIGLVIGCALANLFSPMLWLDVAFGTLQTAIAVVLIGYIRPLFVALLLSIGSMVIIGFEIALVSSLDMWWLYSLQVMAGETIALFAVAYPLSFLLRKSQTFMNIVRLSSGKKEVANENL